VAFSIGLFDDHVMREREPVFGTQKQVRELACEAASVDSNESGVYLIVGWLRLMREQPGGPLFALLIDHGRDVAQQYIRPRRKVLAAGSHCALGDQPRSATGRMVDRRQRPALGDSRSR